MINLRKIREEHGLTRQDMASKMKVSVSAYGRRERGEVALTDTDIRMLVNILQVSYDELFKE